MRTTADYLAMITQAYHDQPKFRAMVEALVAPAARLQELAAGLPEAFDLDTAVGDQLDAVGLWIGRTREVYVPIEGVFFRWDTITAEGWDAGVWQGEFESGSVVSVLSDAEFRRLLLGKVAANNWKGDRAGQYAILDAAFGKPGQILIIDNQDMSQTVLINLGALTAVERALLEGGYVPIKPAGVRINFEDYALLPWEYGPFWGGLIPGGALLDLTVIGERIVLGGDWLIATAEVPFTDEAVFSVKLDGVEIGTATFAAGGTGRVYAVTVLTTDPTTMSPGQNLTVHAPALTDATGADVGFAFMGTKLPAL